MSNKKLFASKKTKHKFVSVSSKTTLPTNTHNEAGGVAYKLSDKGALAQYAMTGTLNGTYYASDEEQLKKVLELASKVDPKFIAQLAVYSREKGLMKDTPALLAAVLISRAPELLPQIFDRVINDPKMLRNFVQIVRSGATGKKSFGTRTKRLIQKYLENLTDDQLFKANVGNDPSLQDIIKMVHPKPTNKKRSAMYGYLLDKEYNKRDLAPLAKEYERFKKDLSGEIPDVPFQLLTSLSLTDNHWKQIADNATWTQIRMNLSTFARHNVFQDQEMVAKLAKKLSNPESVRKTKVFPYQLFTTYQNMDTTIPLVLTNALQDAMNASLDNIPEFSGKIYVMIDVSGSMSSPITGNRGSVSTKTECVDVAAVFASAILRKNPDAEIIPFDTSVHVNRRLNPRDSVITNAQMLAGFGGGGTDCASALRYINSKNARGSLIIYVSDNQSWANSSSGQHGSPTMIEWQKFKKINPEAKLVNIDIQPYATTQTHECEDIINIGGFSDNVFDVIKQFMEFGNNKEMWVKTIESISL